MAAIKPKDAASLLLYRTVKGSDEVLMGRRPSKSSFMPGVYVFPGGAVDACDARAKPSSKLSHNCAEHMAVGGSAARAQTIAMAAVRETYEETGLLITQTGHPGVVNDESWQAMANLGLSADLSVLRYFGRATTPADQPKRFNARFFICSATEVANLDADNLKDNDELLDLRWVPTHNPDELPLRRVTQFLLKELDIWINHKSHWEGYPMFTQRSGTPVIQRSGKT